MNKNHLGSTLKSIMAENNISVTRISELTGRTRQQVHGDFHRVTIRDEVLEVYAKALKVDKQAFYETQVEGSKEESRYLLEHLSSLEEQFKRLLNQLESKDIQIQSLQEMLKMTLGKYRDVAQFETARIKPMYQDILPALQG